MYVSNYAFMEEQLRAIQLEEVAKWLSMKAFGMQNPSPNDNLTFGCSSSLEQ